MTSPGQLDRVALGEAMRRLRQARGLSVEQAAVRAGRETAMVNAIEHGEIDARWGTVMALLRALDASVGELAAEIDG